MGGRRRSLVDAEDRFQQFVAEREQDKQRRGPCPPTRKDTQADLAGLGPSGAGAPKQEVTQNEIRRKQIAAALADLDKKIAELN